MPTLISCPNFRQLVLLVRLFNAPQVNHYISAFALTFATDRIAEVRNSGVEVLAEVLSLFVREEWSDHAAKSPDNFTVNSEDLPLTDRLLSEIRVGFSQSRNWRRRQSFGRMLEIIIRKQLITHEQFLHLFYNDFIQTSKDDHSKTMFTLCLETNQIYFLRWNDFHKIRLLLLQKICKSSVFAMFAPKYNGLVFHFMQEDPPEKSHEQNVWCASTDGEQDRQVEELDLIDPKKKDRSQNFWCAGTDDEQDRQVKELDLIARLRVTPIHEIPEVPEGEIVFESKCHFEIVNKISGRILLKPDDFKFDCFGAASRSTSRDTEITVSDHRNRVTCLAWNNVSNLLVTAGIDFESSKEFLIYTTFVKDGIRRAKMLRNA
uniref:FPL domain-containing protein n=1 Tax=Ditylenchus dipsaci TaxID=166011 RepID=A0A915E8F0_9BILA